MRAGVLDWRFLVSGRRMCARSARLGGVSGSSGLTGLIGAATETSPNRPDRSPDAPTSSLVSPIDLDWGQRIQRDKRCWRQQSFTGVSASLQHRHSNRGGEAWRVRLDIIVKVHVNGHVYRPRLWRLERNHSCPAQNWQPSASFAKPLVELSFRRSMLSRLDDRRRVEAERDGRTSSEPVTRLAVFRTRSSRSSA